MRNYLRFTSVSRAALLVAAFDGDEFKLAETPIKDGKLVYIIAGKEELIEPGEVLSARSRLTALNSEAAGHRRAKETAEAAYKPFEGLKPDEVRAALDMVKNIKDGDLIKAGEVEKVRAEIKASFDAQLKTANERGDSASSKLVGMVRQSTFGRSKWIVDNLAIPVDVVEATFGRNFTFTEDGFKEAKGANGEVIFSRDPARAGQPADFDEAMKVIIEQYPNRDQILKGNRNGGSGNNGRGGNGTGGKRMINRTEFSAMTPTDQAAFAKEMGAGKAGINE